MYKPKQEGITREAFMADITAYKKVLLPQRPTILL